MTREGLNTVKVGVVGLGLGYSLSHVFTSCGHDVVGVDIDQEAITNPRVDKDTAAWIEQAGTNPEFVTSFECLAERELIFIFVSTPLVNGRLSLRNVAASLESSLEANPKAEYAIISTLPIGGMKTLHDLFPDAKLCYSPPMVKKHQFRSTFWLPPSGWQLFGGHPSMKLLSVFRQAQHPSVKQVIVDEDVAEAAKLCTNMMLATKVVMANAIGGWLGTVKGEQVCDIVGRDPRVGQGYFIPGGAARGPCLPRDLTELEAVTPHEGALHSLLETINAANGTSRILENQR